MDQIDLAGPEAAKQSGAALYSMKAKADGHIAMEVPERPPIYNPLGKEDCCVHNHSNWQIHYMMNGSVPH